MKSLDLGPDELSVFSDAICEYFETTSGEKAEVRSAYLLEGDYPERWNQFHGVIPISGEYVGTVCFSAPKPMLTHVLMLLGDKSYTDASHLDLVGEIANTLSGRARKHFGEALQISPPLAFQGRHDRVMVTTPGKPYAIPFTWRTYEGGLVVNLYPSSN